MITFYKQIARFNRSRRVGKIGPINDGPVAILVAAEITFETDGVVHVVHVHGGICIRADHGGEVGAVTQEHEGTAPQPHFEVVVFFAHGPADTDDQQGGQQNEEGGKTAEEGHVQRVDKEDIEGAGAFDRIRDAEFLYDAGDAAADDKGDDGSPGGRLIAFEIIDHHDGGGGKQA